MKHDESLDGQPALLFTVPQGARALGISEPGLWRLVASGAIRSVKIGRARRIPASEVQRVAAEGVTA